MAVPSVSFGNYQQPFFQQDAPAINTPVSYAPNFGTAFPSRLQDDNDCVPTPPAVVQQMIDLLGVQPGMRVLEPSAGTGNIADEVAKCPGVNLDVVEYDRGLREHLRDRGHHVVGNDFLTYDGGTAYDRIIMNPPFSTKDKTVGPQSIAHVKHAYDMLKPGGKMAAVLPDWIFRHNKGRIQRQFHQWLQTTGSYGTVMLERGTFDNDESTTQVPTRILIINKPEATKAGKKQNKRTRFSGGLDLVA